MDSTLAWSVVEKAVTDKNPTDLLVGADAVQETDGEELAQTLRWLLKCGEWPYLKTGRPNPKQKWGLNLPLPAFAVASAEKRSGVGGYYRNRQVRTQRKKYSPTLKALLEYATDYRKQGEKFFAI